ncbi:MAG TPA: DUF748 domain-containing protein [Steroidobacteraceae bacterium]|nr:DUF748 domain-containing protein [Steroidobacteraceae bacterium]
MARYRRYLIALAVVLVLVAAYALAGFWAVPHFGRKAAVDFVRQHYGRTLQLGEIRFNPFTLRLDVSDLSLPDADGRPLLAFAHLHVDLQLASLWRLGPSFKEILLERPFVRAVIRKDGALNLADLGKGFPEEPRKQPPPRESKPMRLYIGRFAVTGGAAAFADETRAFSAELKPIGFELRDFSTVGNRGGAYTLNATLEQGGRFNWNGTLQLTPFASRGQFEFADVRVHTLWEYLRELMPCELAAGMLGLRGDYELNSGAGPLQAHLGLANATVTELGVRPKGGGGDYVRVAKISVDDTRVDLGRHSVDVAKVALSGGDIKVWLDEQGRLNLLDLAGRAPAADAAAEAAPPARAPVKAQTSGGNQAAWSVAVPQISIEALKIAFEDRQVKPALAVSIAPLNLQVAGFNTRPDAVLDVALDSSINGTGKLTAKGKVTPQNGALSLHADLAALGLPLIQPYLSRYTSMTLAKGALGAHVDLEHAADGTLQIKGSTRISDLRTVDDKNRRDFVTWKELKVEDASYRSRPQSLRIKSVTLVQPYARMIIFPDRTTNVGEILRPAGSKPAATPVAQEPTTTTAAPAPAKPAPGAQRTGKAEAPPPRATPPKPLTPWPLSIGAIRFVNATLDYTDLWIKPSFSVGIQTLNGAITGLSSDPHSRAKVDLSGKIERYSPAHIGGELNVLSAALYTDITMSYKDIDLTIVNPYSGHFVGYKIDKGKLSVDVSYKIDNRKLDAKQHFVVDQLELGDRVESPDAIHAPIKLAVALLKDRNGIIDLDLPMSGSIDDPTFRVGPLIWKAFVNLIVKVATAPFALLGHMFGGGEHMNVVEFAPGSAELEPAAKEQLGAVAKSLKERPQLKLDVPIVYSRDTDAPQLANAKLDEALAARIADTRQGRRHPQTALEETLADPEKHYKLLLEQYRAVLGKDSPLPDSAQAVEQAKRKEAPPYDQAIDELSAALRAKNEVSDADLEALGKARAQAIQGALVADGQVEAARVFIVAAAAKPAAGERVKVELALK